jgi:chromosome segregation ATPase
MAQKYNKTLWVNEETSLNAANLNKIEEGIEANSEDILKNEADISKLDESLKDIKLDMAADKTANAKFQEQINKQLDEAAQAQSESMKYLTDFITPIMKESNRVGYGEVGSMTLPIEGNTLDAQLTELLEASY